MWAPQPSARAPKPLSWQADCSTADIGALECSKMLAALDRAAAAFSAALVFRRPVAIKISAIAAGAEPPAKRADAVGAGGPAPDTLASTAAPQHQLPARIGSSLVSYPQALAKQLTVLQASEMSAFDALILIQWPAGGFFFEGDVASAASLNSPNFDAVLHHELLHAFGLASAFTVLPDLEGMLTTTLAATNSSMETQSSFALLSPFDSFLIDVQAQERLSAIWSNAAPFRANKADFAAEFANNAAAKSAERLYALATTPDSVAFTASDGQNILVETSFEPFSLGQSLSHFSSTGNTSSIFFVATAPTGPLDDAWFVDRQKRILGLDPTVASALKTLGWTLCVDSKDACSNAAAAGGSSGPSLPPWLIAVIVLVGVGFMALAGFLIYRLFRRREQSKGSKPAAPLDAAPSNDSINAGPKLGPPVASSETVFLRPAPALPEGFQVVRADSMSGYITDSSAVSIHSSERASLARTSMQSFGLSGDQIAGATALGSSSFTGQQMDEYAMRSIPLGSWQHMRAASAPVSVLALQQSVVPMPGYIARPMPSPSASWGDRRRTPSSTPPTGPTDPSPPGSPGMIMANGSRSLPTEQWRRTRTGSTPRSIDPATPGLGVPAAEPWQRMRMSSTPRAIGGMAVAPGLPQSGPMDAAFRSLPVQERMHTAMVPMSRGLASTDTLPSRRNVTTIVLPPSAFQGSGSGTTPMVTPGGTRRKSRRPNGAGQPLGTPGPLPTPGQRMMMPGQGQATPSGMTPGMTPGTASIPTGTPLETPATLAEPKDYFAIPVERDPSGTV